MSRTEKRVQLEIKRALETLGFHVSDLSQPRASMQTPGLPDLYAIQPDWPMTVWIEVKRPGGQPTEHQKAWHRTARSAGNLVLVADSVEAVVDYLTEHGAPLEKSA